jgi:hypothetical protein
MLKALKVILIVYGAISVVMGVLHIFAPGMLLSTMGLAVEDMPAACMLVLYSMAMVGVSFVAGGIFLIIAGTRDILRNILWVQFALLWAILAVAIAVFSVLMGYVAFSQAMGSIITDGVFFILLMAFYPWGRTGD